MRFVAPEWKEHRAALGRRGAHLERLGERDHCGGRCIVVRAVIDERAGLTHVIVVAGHDHVFVLEDGIGSLDHANG